MPDYLEIVSQFEFGPRSDYERAKQGSNLGGRYDVFGDLDFIARRDGIITEEQEQHRRTRPVQLQGETVARHCGDH